MNNLLKIWNENKPVVNAWLSIPNSFTAEAFGKIQIDPYPSKPHPKKVLILSAFVGFLIGSFWVLLLTIIPVIYQNFAAFFLSSIVNPIELGLYFGASKIYRAFNSLFSPIGQAVYPRLVASNEIDSDEAKTLFLKVFWILFILGLICIGVLQNSIFFF